MELFKLRYFSCVCECGSFTKAADRLFLSRQALRQAVRSLETELGTALFRVEGKVVTPTPAGRSLYVACQGTLEAYAQLEESLPRVLAGKAIFIRHGQVTGIHDVFTREEMAARRSENYASFSSYTTTSCDDLRLQLRHDRLDIVSLISTEPADESLFLSRCVKRGQLFCMVHRDNPLASHEVIEPQDLRGVPFLTQGAGYDLHRHLETICNQAGVSLNVVYRAPAFYELVSQVQAGLGVGYYPVGHIELYDAPDVRCIPFDGPMEWMLLCLIMRDTSPHSALYEFWGRG